jgi:CDP-glucose 4,6-dehydratase
VALGATTDTAGWCPNEAFWQRRAVGVTGATGFIGAHLVQKLVDLGASVVILARDRTPESPLVTSWMDRVSVVHGDLTQRDLLERMLSEYEVQTVVHLAAQSQVGVANAHALSTLEANVQGTWNVLEACHRCPTVREVVVASTDKAYGRQPVLPYTEDMPLLAINPYDVSKACADLITQSYSQVFGVPAVITRCGNFFGPGDTNWNRIVPGTIRSVLRGERPVLRSDGTMVRDYIFCADGVLAYLALAEALAQRPDLAGQAFNFSTGDPLTVLELVAAIQRATGTDLEPDIRGIASNEIDEQYLSSAKARETLGWEPTYTLEAALDATVHWYRDHLLG